jgi:hypothetical protein
MELSVFQVNNVLRVYKDQLRHNKIVTRSVGNSPPPDRVNISAEAKRKIFVDKIASGIVGKITQYGPQDTIEKEVFKKLENEYGANLDISQKGSNELLFKVIDEGGETLNSLSIDDSQFLAHKLQEIALETVDNIEKDKLGDL